MKIQYKRNWQNICKLKDPDFKYLITWLTWGVDDDEFIGRLNAAFPELFSDVETSMHIPLSALRQQAINDYLFGLESEDESKETISYLRFAEWFQWTLTHHRFPEVYLFADEGYDNRPAVPEDVLRQLRSVEFKAGNPVHVTYNGTDCLVGYILDNYAVSPMTHGWRVDNDPKRTNLMVHLVPAKYIDLTA